MGALRQFYTQISRPRVLVTGALIALMIAFAVVSMAAASTTASPPTVHNVSRGSEGVIAGNQPAIVATPTEVAAEVKAQADAMQEVLINIYQRADPAVVNIEVSVDKSDDIDFTRSGFVVDTDGHIVTNNHMIDNG